MSNTNTVEMRLRSADKIIRKKTPPQNNLDDFNAYLVRHPHSEQASELVSDQAGLEFDAKNDELAKLKGDLPELKKQSEHSGSRLDAAEKKLLDTPQWIKSGTDPNNTQSGQTPIKDWQPQDQISMLLLLVGLVVLLVMSAVNVYSNLINSGVPIFIEQKWTAICLSMLAPAGAISLKFVSMFFDHYKSRRRYTLIMFAATGLSFLAWVMLFSMNYSGVSADIDWDSLGEDSATGSMLVFIQLLTEILGGAALALAAADIGLKYSPELYRENMAYLNHKNARDTYQADHEKLAQDLSKAQARLHQLQAQRQAYINERLAAFLERRNHFNSLNSI